MSNLTLRILSALLLAPLVLGAIIAGGHWFAALLAITAPLMLIEWLQLTNSAKSSWWLPLAAATLSIILAFCGYWNLTFATLALATITRILFRGSRWSWMGLWYVCLPILSLYALSLHATAWVLYLFLTVWATDIGGYAFGRMIGGPKLAPSISPGKTWSGLAGAVFCAGLTGIAFAQHHGAPWINLALPAMLLAIIAQAGDLTESKIKRLFGKKDSGRMIPGHGGILDRVDGLLFAAPALALWLHFHSEAATWMQ